MSGINNGLAIHTENSSLAAMMPLLWEIGNLKRIRSRNSPISLAANLFQKAWKNLADGYAVREVAIKTAAESIVAAGLGAINAEVLRSAGLSEAETAGVIKRSFDLSAILLEANLRAELRSALDVTFGNEKSGSLSFVEKLMRQPRSGATKPNAPKLVFDAPENHAEHSMTVGIYGVLLAPLFDAEIATVFLIALAHHFHNADLPDSGFAGEELLGEFLPRIFNGLREKCLSELPEHLSSPIKQTFDLTINADSPESKAFHAADVIDRVLQMRHHAEANKFSLSYALEEMELVHAGAVQEFHYEILREAKLI